MNRSEIENKLRLFDELIKRESHALNKNGVWLFLAVLGAWSVYQPVIRIIALLGAIFIFEGRLRDAWKHRKSLKAEVYSFRKTITDSLKDKEVRECLQMYERVNCKFSRTSMLCRNCRFIFCWCFMGISLVYFMFLADDSLFDIVNTLTNRGEKILFLYLPINQ